MTAPARDGEAVIQEVAQALWNEANRLQSRGDAWLGDLYVQPGLTQHLYEALAMASIATLKTRGWRPRRESS